MSRMKLYQIFDKVAGAVEGPVTCFRADGPAIRSFYSLLGAPQTTPGQHPADFNLLCVGEQEDDGSIVIQPEVGGLLYPIPVALGAAWVEQRNREATAQASLTLEGR